MGPNSSKWSKIIQNCQHYQKLSKKSLNVPKLLKKVKIVQSCFISTNMVQKDPKLSKIVQQGPK